MLETKNPEQHTEFDVQNNNITLKYDEFEITQWKKERKKEIETNITYSFQTYLEYGN